MISIKTVLISALVFLSACTNEPKSKMNIALEIMGHHASDVTIEIEPGTPKLFEKNNGWFYVCGRALVKQPSMRPDMVQRFIINVNPEKQGLALYEVTDNEKHEDKNFMILWADRCDDYVFPFQKTHS